MYNFNENYPVFVVQDVTPLCIQSQNKLPAKLLVLYILTESALSHTCLKSRMSVNGHNMLKSFASNNCDIIMVKTENAAMIKMTADSASIQ